MKLSIISASEKELLKKIESSNNVDVSSWRISNVIIPIITIIISLVCFGLFKSSDKVSLIAFINLLLNGSIPMIALNRVGGSGIYLFKYDRSKERSYGISDTYMLRTKLILLFVLIVIGSVILYVYQVLHNPFSLSCWNILVFSISILSVYLSMNISKKVYLLQDKLIDKTYEQEIIDDSKDKGHAKNW